MASLAVRHCCPAAVTAEDGTLAPKRFPASGQNFVLQRPPTPQNGGSRTAQKVGERSGEEGKREKTGAGSLTAQQGAQPRPYLSLHPALLLGTALVESTASCKPSDGSLKLLPCYLC